MANKRQTIWWIALCFAAIITAFISLPGMILKPGSIILQIGGDGFKNFYTYFYHSLYGHGIWFQGMNYPFGEHIVYADGQPFLSVPLSYLRGILPINGKALVIILHYTIVASYITSVIFIGVILRRFRVLPALSVIFSMLIVLLSPQLFRIFGHYGLSYFCVIPMLFYFTIKYHDTGSSRYAVYIFLLGSIAAFAHPYFVAVVFVWCMMYALAYTLVIKKGWKHAMGHVVPLVVSVVAVFAIVKIVMALTDPVKDRPVEPFGTLTSCTTGNDIVTSVYSPIWNALDPLKLIHVSILGEGYTYLGFAVIIITACSLVYMAVMRIRKRKIQEPIICEDNFSPVWLLIALGTLLLGMGVPFVWHMEWLLDYLSVFRQFRSLGRFSWMFYYIISIYAVVVFSKWYANKMARDRGVVANIVLALVIIVWSWETAGYLKDAWDHQNEAAEFNYDWTFSQKDQIAWEVFLKAHNYAKEDFQAILLCPYLHIGTEKIWLAGDRMWVFSLGARASMQLQLPMVNVMMSRSSWSQAFEQAKLAGGPLTDKSFLNKLNNKPLLLIQFDAEPASPDASYLLEASDSLGNFAGANVYACYPERIKQAHQQQYEKWKPFYSALIVTDDAADTVMGNTQDWFICHFDTGKYAEPVFGSGALPAFKDDYTVLTEFHVQERPDTVRQYEFSCWALMPDDSYKAAEVKVEVFDSVYNVLQTSIASPSHTTDFQGMWFRLASYFDVKPEARHIRLQVRNVPNPSYIAIDEVLVRPVNATVISKDRNGIGMVNNHILYNSAKK